MLVLALFESELKQLLAREVIVIVSRGPARSRLLSSQALRLFAVDLSETGVLLEPAEVCVLNLSYLD